MSTPQPPPGPEPSYVHEETVYEEQVVGGTTGNPAGARAGDESGEQDEPGDWDRTLTDRIRQLVEQPGPRKPPERAQNESLSAIAAGSLDDSTAGVDWGFVQQRELDESTAHDPNAVTRHGNDEEPAGNDDKTPLGQRMVMEALAAGSGDADAPEVGILRRAVSAADTQSDDAASDTVPAPDTAADTRPVPGSEAPPRRRPLGAPADDGGLGGAADEAAALGFGIMRRPKR